MTSQTFQGHIVPPMTDRELALVRCGLRALKDLIEAGAHHIFSDEADSLDVQDLIATFTPD